MEWLKRMAEIRLRMIENSQLNLEVGISKDMKTVNTKKAYEDMYNLLFEASKQGDTMAKKEFINFIEPYLNKFQSFEKSSVPYQERYADVVNELKTIINR